MKSLRNVGRLFLALFLRSRRALWLALATLALAHVGHPPVSRAQFLEPSFNPGSGPNAEVQGAAVTVDGKILITGYFTSYNATPRNYIARLNADGSLDATFTASLAIGKNQGTCRGHAVVIQPDGRILVGGMFTKVNGSSCQNIARLTANSVLDASFAGSATGGAVASIVLQNDGKILIAGGFTAVNGVAQRGYARLMPNGSLDGGFSYTLGGADSAVTAVAIYPSGRVLIGGYFQHVNGQECGYLARLNSDGSVDNTFDTQTIPNLGPVLGLALKPFVPEDPNAPMDARFKILLSCRDNLPLMKLSADGLYEGNLAEGALVDVTRMQVAPGGSVLAVGTALGPSSVRSVVQFSPEGVLDPSFWPIRAQISFIDAITSSATGLLVAGDFNSISGRPCPRIARLAQTTVSPGFSQFHLAAPTVASTRTGSGWTASVTLPVTSETGPPLAGVTIKGNWVYWSGKKSGSPSAPIYVSATSGPNGQCAFNYACSKNCTSADFTITEIIPASGSSSYYDSLYDETHPPFGRDDKLGVTAP